VLPAENSNYVEIIVSIYFHNQSGVPKIRRINLLHLENSDEFAKFLRALLAILVGLVSRDEFTSSGGSSAW